MRKMIVATAMMLACVSVVRVLLIAWMLAGTAQAAVPPICQEFLEDMYDKSERLVAIMEKSNAFLPPTRSDREQLRRSYQRTLEWIKEHSLATEAFHRASFIFVLCVDGARH